MKTISPLAISFPTFFIAFFLCFTPTAFAQKYFTAEKSYALKLGRTKPLHGLYPAAPTDSTKLKFRKENKPVYPPNFQGRRHLDYHFPHALPKGNDPLFNANHLREPLNEILPTINFEGITQANVNSGVPDVNGDISRDYYVEIVNSTYFRVYNKMGQAVSNLIHANSIWSQVQQSSAGDPILLYDQLADRWLLTEFPSNNRVLLAVSVTNDPMGSWDAYAFQTPRFPDFPKYGIWPDAYYLTTNENGSNFPIYAFNRADMLAGFDTIRFQRLTVPKHGGVFFEVGQPVDWDGMIPPPAGSPGLVVKLNDDDWLTTNQDHIMLHMIHIDWDTSANSNIEIIEIPTAPFDTDGCSLESTGGFSCVPQPNGQGIDGAQWIITNKAQYRNFETHESFVMSFMVDVTGDDVAGIRWIEFRKSATEDWHLYQEGTVGSTDGLHRFMSSIGIDGEGNIGLAYSVSGPEKHPSLRYTGRYKTDPPGMMTFKEYEFAAGTGSRGSDRFGDYASMSVDPTDDKSFWFAGEFVKSGGGWSTKIVSFNAVKDTVDIFPVSLISPENGPNLNDDVPLTIRILNRGLNTVYDFKIAYEFMGEWVEENAVADSLSPDSFYVHTFQTGMDFGPPGQYPVRVATLLDADRNHLNDTLEFIISKIAFRDVALAFESPGQHNVVCAESNVNSVTMRNVGADVIHTILFVILQENIPVDTMWWLGSLEPGEEEIFSFTVTGLSEGINSIGIDVLEINFANDEIPTNNFAEWQLTAKPSGEELYLNLLTDNFPQETTWQLLDSSSNIIASAGPFADQQYLYVTQLCLDPDACYTMVVNDSYGDGMSGQGVQGDYEILNNNGEVIASLSMPNFGEQNINQFCLTEECLLEVTAGIVHESYPGASDGWIMAEVANGLGNVSFSIDSGQHFQTGYIFSNLSSGLYLLIAMDDAGCSDTITLTIHVCNIETHITTVPATTGDIGEIHIDATGGVGPITYSLNGAAFVADSFFLMLEPGQYIVYTRDSLGCEAIDTVTVSTQVGTTFIRTKNFISITPNPGPGVYDVLAVLATGEIFVPYKIYSETGQPLLHGTLAKYDNHHKGEISLRAFPPGIYYVSFFVGDQYLIIKRLIRV